LNDYETVLEIDGSIKVALEAKKTLPIKVKEQQEKEKAEMMGKLKELGNGFLSLFGMSLDNFQMNQDPATGGYSIAMKK